MLYVFVFYFVFSKLLGGRQENFLLFLMCAKIPYMWFSKSVTRASSSIVSDRGIISQIDIPKTIFPYASIQVSLYKEIPVFLLLFAMCTFYGFMPTMEWLWLIPLLITMYLMILTCSLIAAVMVCYADDVRMVINMAMLFLMFTSGIFFDVATIREPVQSYLLIFNPLAFMCDAFRKILMHKGSYSVEHMLVLLALFSVTTLAMNLFYRNMSRTIAAKVVNA